MTETNKSSEDLELFHYGVKGMKWGVRKDGDAGGNPTGVKARYRAIRDKELVNMTVTTRNGTKVEVTESRTAKPAAFFNALRKNGVAENAAYKDFGLSVDGKKVGNASFEKVSDDELNLVWLGVKQSERGKGYATAVFDSAVQYGRAEGMKELTLEVPGNAPDARHIYEKQGFKVDKKKTQAMRDDADEDDDVWGGLTAMSLDLTDRRLSHSAMTEEEELELALTQTFPQFTGKVEEQIMGESVMEHLSASDYELFHYGVKGMKWGVRRSKKQLAEGYSQSSYDYDRRSYSKRFANNVNKRVARGADLKTARSKERVRRANVRAAVGLGLMVASTSLTPMMMNTPVNAINRSFLAADKAAGRVAERVNMRRGMKKANDILADSRGITSYETISLSLDDDGVWR